MKVWATCHSRAEAAINVSKEHEDPDLAAKLSGLQKLWETDCPSEEWSIITEGGEKVYMGRYGDGIILRLNDDKGQMVVLTDQMVVALKKVLGAWF